MALILEVLDERGAVSARVRVKSLPFTIGRAGDNDLVLDDLYADAHHARVALDETGAVVVEDLGSVNGLLPADADERAAADGGTPLEAPAARLSASAGRRVRVGQTVLRFRDAAEPVPPALPLPRAVPTGAGNGAASATARSAASATATVTETTAAPAPGRDPFAGRWLRAGLMIGALAALALWAWLDSYSRTPGTEVLAVTLGFGILGAMWAGGWAVGARVAGHRFRFGAHYTVFSAAVLISLAVGAVSSWLAFLFPDSPLATPVGWALSFALTGLLFATHLRYASALSPRRRWRNALIATTLLYALGGAFALAAREPFTSVATFSGITRPLAARWIPTTDIEHLVDDAAELRRAVDEMAAPAGD